MSEEKNVFEMSDDEEDGLMPPQKNSMIADSKAGQVYDWETAPDYVKSAPRIDLDGKVIVLEKAEIFLPNKEVPWSKTMNGKNDVKRCQFKITYEGNQSEFLSGMNVFSKEGGLYSHPTIFKEGNNQVSNLLKIYAKFKSKKPEEVSLKEFLAFLNSKPKVRIVGTTVKNPTNGNMIKKNLIGEFVQ